MKKLINSILVFTVVFAGFTSCETVDFADINQNPNEPNQPVASSLLANAEGALADLLTATTPNLYVQYLSNGQYEEESRYQTLNWDWEGWYAVLTDLQRVIDLNTNEDTREATATGDASNANQIAVATILRVYFLEMMTTRWGQIPYSEALQGLDAQFPTYDTQEEIYNGLFDELDMALDMIEPGQGPNGDYLFAGNMSRWETFGQTLKMTMALRLSVANPTLGAQKFNEALGNAISSNNENLYYSFLADENNDNPWEDRFLAPSFRRDYLVSDVFVDNLVGSGESNMPEDPRLKEMAEPATSSPGNYIGAPYGAVNSATDDYSFITEDIIFTQDAPAYIYTYAQVLFARAEAAHLGWTDEDAEMLYDMGVLASMEQWGSSNEEATAYLAANPYTGPQDIGYEKWVALYLQGYEAWAEWRRLKAMGYEKELTAPAELLSNATDIPDRQAYPATAGSLNEENYNQAVSSQGPDELNTVLWIFGG